MWMLRGQQVQIPTHGQDERAYGLGAVNYHTGETVMITRKHKRRVDVAAFCDGDGAAGDGVSFATGDEQVEQD